MCLVIIHYHAISYQFHTIRSRRTWSGDLGMYHRIYVEIELLLLHHICETKSSNKTLFHLLFPDLSNLNQTSISLCLSLSCF